MEVSSLKTSELIRKLTRIEFLLILADCDYDTRKKLGIGPFKRDVALEACAQLSHEIDRRVSKIEGGRRGQ
jgi:hypothetical protein